MIALGSQRLDADRPRLASGGCVHRARHPAPLARALPGDTEPSGNSADQLGRSFT